MHGKYPHIIRAALGAALTPVLVILLCLIALSIANLRDTMVPKMFLSVMLYGAIFYIGPLLGIAIVIYTSILRYFKKLSFWYAYTIQLSIFLIYLLITTIKSGSSNMGDLCFYSLIYSTISASVFIVWFTLAKARNIRPNHHHAE